MLDSKLKSLIRITIIAVVFFIVFVAYQAIGRNIFATAKAETETDSEKGDYQVINTTPASNTPQKNDTKTITTKMADTITQTTTTTIRHDSDGDGLYDDEDPHPTINEYFIVKDDNLNGIDDQYEQ